jgi:hypothetical protein
VDKYDEAIEYLTKHPNDIYASWGSVDVERGGVLFMFAARDSENGLDNDTPCGCLTQIRAGYLDAETSELTERIRADERIPKEAEEIKVEHLPVFAEWQRTLDKELNRD